MAFLGSDLVGESSIVGPESYPASGGEPESFTPDGCPEPRIWSA